MPDRDVVAHLTDGRSSVVLIADGGLPEIAHWGAALGGGELDPSLFDRPVPSGGLDVDAPIGLVTESSRGWFGRPGIEGHRDGGADFAPRFELEVIEGDERRVHIEACDRAAQVGIGVDMTIHDSGLLRVDVALTNEGESAFDLDALRVTLPVPGAAEELLTLVGRHALEFVERRTPWSNTCVTVENRHGKTSHERSGVVFAGEAGFGEHHGEVWGVHLGWSGNYEFVCDAGTAGRRVIQVGEVLLPGEVRLQPGERYAAPPVFAAYAPDGLNRISNTFHDHLRSRPSHPALPRPVHLNTWEAVYFDLDLDKLKGLADRAARVGIDRFVLDDGWFGGRRNDAAGLGDWSVSPDVWPSGLDPLISHVRNLDMEFGIWVEPEMVNPDSELYRKHPDWVLADSRHPHVLGRNQLVLDIGRAEVRDHVFEQIDRLLSDHDISYVKWDHNRDLVAPASGGRAGVHRQTLGIYELLDRLRRAHPGVDFETCASGGGRVDFGILERTDRVWTSDSLDALDRHRIQRGFSLVFPPELMGSHVGSPVSHATGRSHRLAFRALAAFFGTMGVEWNLLEATEEELDELEHLLSLHKRFAPLLHTGDVVRADHPDPTVEIHGVVAKDGSEALFAATRLASGVSHHTPPVRLPRLDPDRTYELSLVSGIAEPPGPAVMQPRWFGSKAIATGRHLSSAGFSLPQLHPESSLLLHLRSATAGD